MSKVYKEFEYLFHELCFLKRKEIMNIPAFEDFIENDFKKAIKLYLNYFLIFESYDILKEFRESLFKKDPSILQRRKEKFSEIIQKFGKLPEEKQKEIAKILNTFCKEYPELAYELFSENSKKFEENSYLKKIKENNWDEAENYRPPFKNFNNYKRIRTIDGIGIFLRASDQLSPEQELNCKNFLFIGETGSGKTTLLNAMANYLSGVKPEDNFRVKMIAEDFGKNQSHSQTSKVSIYSLIPESKIFPFPVRLIDTPGLRGTTGISQDLKIKNALWNFISNKCPDLHGICFVVRASTNRLTSHQKNIIQKVLEIFGKDVSENFFGCFTFYNGQKPLFIESLKKENVPLAKNFYFNNESIYPSEEGGNSTNAQSLWEAGVNNFKKFFEELKLISPVSLETTRKVIHSIQTIESETRFIKDLKEKKEVLSDMKNSIREKEEDIRNNIRVKIKGVKKVFELVDSADGEIVTICSNCKMNCHVGCRELSPFTLNSLKWCTVMDEGVCRVCQCGYWLHSRSNKEYKETEKIEWMNYQEIQEYFLGENDEIEEDFFSENDETAEDFFGENDKIQNIDSVCETIKDRITNAEEEITNSTYKIRCCLRNLEKMALRPYQANTKDYSEVMLKVEKTEKILKSRLGKIFRNETIGFGDKNFSEKKEENTKDSQNLYKIFPTFSLYFGISEEEAIQYLKNGGLENLKKQISKIIPNEDFQITNLRIGSIDLELTYTPKQVKDYLKNVITGGDTKKFENDFKALAEKFSKKTFEVFNKKDLKASVQAFYLDKSKKEKVKQEVKQCLQKGNKRELRQTIKILVDEIKEEVLERKTIINSNNSNIEKAINNMISFNKYNQKFKEELEKAKKDSIFEYVVDSLSIIFKDSQKYEEAKAKCPNCQTKILFHGTESDTVPKIITDQFLCHDGYIGEGVYFSDMLDLIRHYYSRKALGYKPTEIFYAVGAEIFFDKNKAVRIDRYIMGQRKKTEKNGIHYGISERFGGDVISDSKVKSFDNKCVGREYMISFVEQINPIYGLKLKRNEYCIIWRDPNFKYNNEFREYIENLKKFIEEEVGCNLYIETSTERALWLVNKKKYNKIILVSNIGPDLGGKDFVEEARKIIGCNAYTLFSSYSDHHLKWVKDFENALFSNEREISEQFLKDFSIGGLRNLKIKAENQYCPYKDSRYVEHIKNCNDPKCSDGAHRKKCKFTDSKDVKEHDKCKFTDFTEVNYVHYKKSGDIKGLDCEGFELNSHKFLLNPSEDKEYSDERCMVF